jgi:DNA-binding MarR family transcriptional regulator
MTPEQFSSALRTLGLGIGGAASALSLDARKIRRMLKGQEGIGPEVAEIITVLLERRQDREARRSERMEANAMMTKHSVTETIAQHFRDGTLEWMTAKALARKFGATQDHVKRVADKMVDEGLADKRKGQRGTTEYISKGAKS